MVFATRGKFRETVDSFNRRGCGGDGSVMANMISRRGVVVTTTKRTVCAYCREYINKGQHAYRYSNIDPRAVTIKSIYSHILCGDERGRFTGGTSEDTGVTDSQILKFWESVEALVERRKQGGVDGAGDHDSGSGVYNSQVPNGGAAKGRDRKRQKRKSAA
jgi:hypothetical protein